MIFLRLCSIISFGSLVRRLVHCPSTYSSKTKQLIVYIYTERDESTQPLSKFCTYIIVFRSTKLELALLEANCNVNKHLLTDPLAGVIDTQPIFLK